MTTYTSNGSWKCPTGLTSVLVECWGAGGQGGAAVNEGGGIVMGGTGGGGGAYAKKLCTVTPGSTYTVIIGDPGDTAPGEGSQFVTSGGTQLVLAANGAKMAAQGDKAVRLAIRSVVQRRQGETEQLGQRALARELVAAVDRSAGPGERRE